jgi:hypothetical protein
MQDPESLSQGHPPESERSTDDSIVNRDTDFAVQPEPGQEVNHDHNADESGGPDNMNTSEHIDVVERGNDAEVVSLPTIDSVMDRIKELADEALRQQKEYFIEIINAIIPVSRKVTIKSGNADESGGPSTEIIIDSDVDLSRIYESNISNMPLGLPTDTSLRSEFIFSANMKPVSRVVITIPVSAGVSNLYFKDSSVDPKVIHAIDEYYVRTIDRPKQATD